MKEKTKQSTKKCVQGKRTFIIITTRGRKQTKTLNKKEGEEWLNVNFCLEIHYFESVVPARV
jgi:hypothetical protein